MDAVVIDSIRRSDLRDLYDLYVELTGEEGDFEAMRRCFDAVSSDPSYRLVAARLDGKVIGSVMTVICHKLSRDCRPFLVMENFVVASGCRRRGVGAKLLAEVERSAVRAGCEAIHFISSSQRREAHVFYAAMGYDPDEVRGFRKKLPRRSQE